VIVIWQAPVPAHAPSQPVNWLPAPGLAVNATIAPLPKLPVHVEPQSMPDGLLVTRPEPLPALVTARSNADATSGTAPAANATTAKVALTRRARSFASGLLMAIIATSYRRLVAFLWKLRRAPERSPPNSLTDSVSLQTKNHRGDAGRRKFSHRPNASAFVAPCRSKLQETYGQSRRSLIHL
jgi:hypothetical protein